jgi:hypothetical protein
MDPRINVVEKRLEKVGKIIAVAGGKAESAKAQLQHCLHLFSQTQIRK